MRLKNITENFQRSNERVETAASLKQLKRARDFAKLA